MQLADIPTPPISHSRPVISGFPLFTSCSVLATIVNNVRFTVRINYDQTCNNVEIEKKICCFSLIVLFIAQNVEIAKFFFFINLLYLKIIVL